LSHPIPFKDLMLSLFEEPYFKGLVSLSSFSPFCQAGTSLGGSRASLTFLACQCHPLFNIGYSPFPPELRVVRLIERVLLLGSSCAATSFSAFPLPRILPGAFSALKVDHLREISSVFISCRSQSSLSFSPLRRVL